MDLSYKDISMQSGENCFKATCIEVIVCQVGKNLGVTSFNGRKAVH